jgi:hypothetical protein
MQLLAIGLYSHEGRRRRLDFQPGRLNVISGLSRTGKTELLKIIDFCAGRRTPHLAPGPITERVAWFAALFEAADGGRVVTARPQPTGASSQRAMLRVGVNADLPVAGDLEVNADFRAVRAQLDDLLGLGRFEVEQYTGVRDQLRASISQAIQFCLQAQTELISPSHLFHRGGETRVAADFEEMFDYFIGAIDESLLDARRRAAELRRQVRGAEQALERLNARAEEDVTRERALVVQAVAAGLLPAVARDATPRQMLHEALSAREPDGDTSEHAEGPNIAQLRAEVDDARTRLRHWQERRAALSVLDTNRDSHAGALSTQLGRLGVVEQIDDIKAGRATTCVVCGAPLERPDPTLDQLAADAAELGRQLSVMRGAGRDIAPAETELDARIAEARLTLATAREALESAIREDLSAQELARASERRIFVRGVIEGHLGATVETSDAAREQVAERLRRLRDELAAIEPGTRGADIRAEVDARLDAMATDMTEWARELGLEAAAEGLVRLDRRSLNVTVGTPSGRVNLQAMGSGANHVGYHIVAHLALHKHFVRESRPVPRFIVFDQPSLPYFPQGAVDRDAAAGDVDWQAVKTMFTLVDRVVNEENGALQAVITDHASFAGDPWYDEALVEDWHTGTKLVPDDWPTKG